VTVLRRGTIGIGIAITLAGCASTPTADAPIDRVDEGIYRVVIVGGDDARASPRQVAASWDAAAWNTCPEGYEVIEERTTTESGSPVGLNLLGLPVSPAGAKIVHGKSGYVRCSDSPYGLADASFIVREIKTSIPPPADLAICTGEAQGRDAPDPAVWRTRGIRLLDENDLRGAFGCFYRAASAGTDFRDGDADAQFRVARMYERGEGTDASPMMALTWYRRAAVNGHAGAQFRLSELAPP